MPVLTRFDIGGRDAIPFLQDNTLEIEPQLNGRMIAGCTFLDKLNRPNPLTDVFRPEKREPFLIEFDDGRRYGGIVWDIVGRTHIVAGLPDAGVRSVLRLTDYEALLDVVPFNEPIAAGTLKSQIEAFISNLEPHGITLDPAQADGPTLGAQIFDWRTIRQVVDELALQSEWVRRIDADGVLSFIQPGTLTAGTPISEAEGNYRSIRFEDSLNDYRNGVYLRYGPQGILTKTEVFEGDGVTREFPLTYQLVQAGTGVTPAGYVTVTRSGPAVTLENIDADPTTPGPAQWHFDVGSVYDNSIIQDSGETVLGVGETVSISYNAQFPAVAFAGDDDEFAEAGPFIAIIDRPDITDAAIAATTVAAERDRLSGDNGRLVIETLEPGYELGETIELDCPVLGVTETVLLTEMRILELAVNELQERTFVYQLTVLQGNIYRENWREFWRRLRGEEGTGGTPAIPPESDCGGAIVWSDDFNSGTALSADYTVTGSPAKTGGAGPDASQALVFASASEIGRSVSFVGRAGCVSMDVFMPSSGTPYLGVLLTETSMAGTGAVLDITTDNVNPPVEGFYTYHFGLSSTPQESDPNLWTTGTWFNCRIAWQVSTYVGPGEEDHDLDGYVRIYVDGVLAWSTENVKVGTPQTHQTEPNGIRISGGDGCIVDNLVIRDA